jgi:dipeptidyl aminopeptidase/acylaminoacyl peptidase
MILSSLSSIPLIPRQLLLGNPSRMAPELSPDGRMLAWRAPVDNVMNIWVASIDALGEAAPVTRLSGRPIIWHDWTPDGRWILFLKDVNGDENYNVYIVEPKTGDVRNLTPFPKVAARLELLSPDLPGRILVGLNDRDAHWHDIWQINLETGARTPIYENTDQLGQFVYDWQGKLRLARRSSPEKGGDEILRFAGDRFEPWRLIPFEDTMTTWTTCFNRLGTHFSMFSSIDLNTSAALRVDAETGAETVLVQHPDADITNVKVHPESFELTAVAVDPGRLTWLSIDPATGKTLSQIKNDMPDADYAITSMNRDDTRWIATVWEPQKAVTFFLVDRPSDTITELFSARPDLKPYRLAGMQATQIKSRDGLNLVSYLTLPADEPARRPRKPLPMVLYVHGGPWDRDAYGYNRNHQWLANRGYAVLSVNYRASRGFGKAFLNAGDKEHAAKIHDDLIDSVDWAVQENIAQRDKVAIMGWSYGGYSAFVGATFTPEVFCCTVPVVGMTDLVTLMENRPPYWAPFTEQFNRRYADVDTEEGRSFLRARSPIYKVDQIKKPMLIGHGANDVRCTLAQSDLIVAAMQRKAIPVTYVVFPDEGHGFYRPENNIAFHAIVEAFLARHLRGRAEPIGQDFEGSLHEIRAGADILDDLRTGESVVA